MEKKNILQQLVDAENLRKKQEEERLREKQARKEALKRFFQLETPKLPKSLSYNFEEKEDDTILEDKLKEGVKEYRKKKDVLKDFFPE